MQDIKLLAFYTGLINVKKFYVRRILRIWPLYYILLIIGLIIVPFFINIIGHDYESPYTFTEVIAYNVFFMPFMVNILFGNHLLSPLWSIGVEEIFYLIWAPLMKFLHKHMLILLICVVLIKFILYLIVKHYFDDSLLLELILVLRFEAMAIGGLGAFIIYNRKKAIENGKAFSIGFQIAMFAIVLMRVFFHKFLIDNTLIYSVLFATPYISSFLIMAVFCWFIVNVSLNKKTLLKLDNKFFNYLGDISYGIYMYHMIVIFTVILLMKKYLLIMHDVAATVLFYITISTLTIIISSISKKFIEDRFLKLKTKFH